jgi:hypothetical protein
MPLSVKTAVSAKYRGAYCEARIQEVEKNIEIRVELDNDRGVFVVPADKIRGRIARGEAVTARVADESRYLPGRIVNIKDKSLYTVGSWTQRPGMAS